MSVLTQTQTLLKFHWKCINANHFSDFYKLRDVLFCMVINSIYQMQRTEFNLFWMWTFLEAHLNVFLSTVKQHLKSVNKYYFIFAWATARWHLTQLHSHSPSLNTLNECGIIQSWFLFHTVHLWNTLTQIYAIQKLSEVHKSCNCWDDNYCLKIRDDVGSGNVWADLIYTACVFIYIYTYTFLQGLLV